MSNPLGGFSLEDARLIHERVLGGKFAQKPADTSRLQTVQNDNYYVLLTEDLPAATDTLTGYSQAEARVIKYTPSDSLDMEESTTSLGIITVTNRNVNFSAATGDLLFVIRSGAEWAPAISGGGGGQPTIRFQINESDCEGRSAIVKVLSSRGGVPGSYEIYGETETNEAGDIVNSRFVVVYDKTGCYLNESNKNLFGRIGHATYLTGRPKYDYQPWTGFEIIALAEQQTECEAF